ncbi:MAG TPA: NfeD family protein, partial [Phototrophicaceae bacterium]|nr:NfeD family protein [Phototrophicaceae bacterium]
LIVIGVLGFLIVPFVDRRFAPFASLGLILQVIGSIALFNGLSVSVPLIAATIVAALIYYFFALLPAMEHQRKSAPALLEDQPIIGMEGRVQSTVDPVGTVYVRGETWTARSDHKLDVGTEVAVVDQEGLTLYVEAVKQKHRPEEG